MPTASRREEAAALIEKQLADGARILQEERTPKIRVSALAFGDAEKFFAHNQKGRGTKPDGVAAESLRELIAAGVLRREGHARGTRYVLLKRPNELFRDPTHVHSQPRTIKARTEAVQTPKPREKAILMIGESESGTSASMYVTISLLQRRSRRANTRNGDNPTQFSIPCTPDRKSSCDYRSPDRGRG